MKKTEPDDNLNILKREIDVVCGYGASLKISILVETQISTEHRFMRDVQMSQLLWYARDIKLARGSRFSIS
jgi:hypothetical protein